MEERGWVTKKMHGSAYQSGFPDLYCCHIQFGTRLVEVKMPWGSFTPAQRSEFHRLSAGGSRIWVAQIHWPLNDSQIVMEIEAIKSKPANWFMFL